MDRTVRLWDLSCGMPLCTSRPHGGTVRALCLDHDLAASGCSDNVVRLWHRSSAEASSADDVYEAEDMDAPADAVDGGAGGQYDASVGGGTVRSAAAASSCCFNLEATPQQLRGHIGPVTCLSLTEGALFSGSWDYSVRVWRRGTWDCVRCVRCQGAQAQYGSSSNNNLIYQVQSINQLID
jgi:WD40 repeat protein